MPQAGALRRSRERDDAWLERHRLAPLCEPAWGFGAVVDSGGERILFDRGGDGPTLLTRLEWLGIERGSVDAVALSHAHDDDAGGLDGVLAPRSQTAVYLPESSPPAHAQAWPRWSRRQGSTATGRSICCGVALT